MSTVAPESTVEFFGWSDGRADVLSKQGHRTLQARMLRRVWDPGLSLGDLGEERGAGLRVVAKRIGSS